MGRSRILILVVSGKHERLRSPEEFIALALLAALDSVAMQAKP